MRTRGGRAQHRAVAADSDHHICSVEGSELIVEASQVVCSHTSMLRALQL